jgi:group I intron endonuclease
MTFAEYCDWYDKCRADRRQYRRSGIYVFKLCGEVVYVGQSRELYSRFASHAEEFGKVHPKELKYRLLKPYIEQVAWEVVEYCDREALNERENYWIEFYNPLFNVKTPSGKQHFDGSEKELRAFVKGQLTIDDLKKLIIKD